jgi:disulfide bond formation protein DsbB
MAKILLQILTPRGALWLLLFGSVGLTLSAFILEYAFGAAPCEMCWWQRYVHWSIGIFAALGLVSGWYRAGLALVGTSAFIGAGIALWQIMVQQKWVPLPATCAGGTGEMAGADTLLMALQNTPPPPCDEVSFTILGLSLAAWNLPLMLGCVGLVLLVTRKDKK